MLRWVVSRGVLEWRVEVGESWGEREQAVHPPTSTQQQYAHTYKNAHREVMMSASTIAEDRREIILVMESSRLGRSRQEMVMTLRASWGLSQSEGWTSTVTLCVWVCMGVST